MSTRRLLLTAVVLGALALALALSPLALPEPALLTLVGLVSVVTLRRRPVAGGR